MFGISSSLYINNMRCFWKIHVDAGKVNDIKPPMCYKPDTFPQ